MYRIFLYRLKNFIKKMLFRNGSNINIGKHVKIDKDVLLRFGAKSIVIIGDNLNIGRGCKVECSP